MPNQLSDEDALILRKVIKSDVVQNEIGAENWDLTEAEEMRLWGIIKGPYLRPFARGLK
jgi:hypothetical protein